MFLSEKDDETVQQNFRLLSHTTLVEARQKFSDMLETQDYRQMRWVKRVFPSDPCFTCTDAFIPYYGDDDSRNIAIGNTVLTPEDIVTLTFYPEEKLHANVCIIIWFKDNKRGEQFREMLELGNPSEAVVRNNMITDALNMSLVYISKTWWNSLTPEQQATVSDLHLRKRRFIFGEVGEP